MSDFFDVEAEDDEEYEDERYEPEPLDAESAISAAILEVERAKQVPLSSSVMLQRGELLELLHHAQDSLPGELQEARRMLREREAFMEGKEREAKRLLEDVRAQAEQMIAKTEVVRQADRRAEEIIEAAKEEARRLRHEADDYCDQKLAGMEIVVDRIMKTVQAGREKLQPAVEAGKLPLHSEDLDSDDEAGGFFDQDLA